MPPERAPFPNKQSNEIILIATILLDALLDAGIDCSLHDAVFGNHLGGVEACLKKENTNVNDKDKSGKTALYIACEMDHTDIIRRFLSVNGIQIQQAKTAAALKIGDQLNVKCDGWTRYYNGKITEINEDGTFAVLFEDGERRNVSTEQIKGNNSYDPLEVACKRGREDIVKLLADAANIQGDALQKLLQRANENALGDKQ